jgi:uncharacterized membrane protein
MGPMSAAHLYMDAVITPNRSLSPRGFLILMLAFGGLNALLAAFFLAIGALPVPIFLGLDVLAIFIAFRVSYHSARLAERVQVSAEEVRVLHESGRLRRTVWRSPTAFTRVDLEHPGEDEARVRLRISERRLTVGAALSPRERADFGQALKAAVARALAERW